MKGNFEALAVMLGKKPKKYKPTEMTEQAIKIYSNKQIQKLTHEEIANIRQELENVRRGVYPKKWRNRRWAVLIVVNLLFTLSFWVDVQLFEGSMITSRVLGMHMADIYSALQILFAYGMMPINLIIGTVTVMVLWMIFGGRAFCSWVCPYHLLAEWAEKIHLKLVAGKKTSDHPFHRGVRPVFWLAFSLLAFMFGYAVFNTVNPVGIVSRALIYGPALFATLWLLMILLFEIFYSRRAWCRYVCPMGLTYGVTGALSPVQITYHLPNCHHEGACRKICEVPHVLDCVIKKRAKDVKVDIGTDCTLCGACVDVCPTNSLRFEIKGFSS